MNMKRMMMAGICGVASLASGVAMAELSANIGVTSNYVWRGLTQTDDGPALQGGLDYAHKFGDGASGEHRGERPSVQDAGYKHGIYAGAWASNVDKGAEIDLYAGYAGEAGDFGYDLGYISYNYTDDAFSENYGEFYLGGSYKILSAKYSIGDYDGTDYTYLDLGLEYEFENVATLALHYGMTDSDAAGADYDDYGISVSRAFQGIDVTLSYTSEDANDEDEVFLSASKSFDLM